LKLKAKLNFSLGLIKKTESKTKTQATAEIYTYVLKVIEILF